MPSKSQLAHERIEASVRHHKIDQGYALGRTVVKCVTVGVVFFFLFKTAQAFAGRETKAFITAVLNMSIDRYIAYAVAAVSGGGYLHTKRQLRRVIREHADYIVELEKRIDPKRSRSRLTDTGEPNKEDRDGT